MVCALVCILVKAMCNTFKATCDACNVYISMRSLGESFGRSVRDPLIKGRLCVCKSSMRTAVKNGFVCFC